MNENNGNNSNNANDLFENIVGVLSLMLQIKNLELNQEQVDSLNAHLLKQDNEYLSKSIEQNAIIIEQNKEIIALLKKLR